MSTDRPSTANDLTPAEIEARRRITAEVARECLVLEAGDRLAEHPCTLPLNHDGPHQWAGAADEIETLRAVVRKLVVEPADTIGPAFVCAGWLDATDDEAEAIQRALGSGSPNDA